MQCREGCAACCIAPSIKQAYANAPEGKKAGEYCVNLETNSLRCRIWGTKDYPSWCQGFQAEEQICGSSREQALEIIHILEHS